MTKKDRSENEKFVNTGDFLLRPKTRRGEKTHAESKVCAHARDKQKKENKSEEPTYRTPL